MSDVRHVHQVRVHRQAAGLSVAALRCSVSISTGLIPCCGVIRTPREGSAGPSVSAWRFSHRAVTSDPRYPLAQSHASRSLAPHPFPHRIFHQHVDFRPILGHRLERPHYRHDPRHRNNLPSSKPTSATRKISSTTRVRPCERASRMRQVRHFLRRPVFRPRLKSMHQRRMESESALGFRMGDP